ncbi:hypothetical protein [Legionella nagasakiensis]|uniref:hypothetical protein n=1 Tax=Legionella nagasakiensis TaxID=535290 RepID=UPI001055CC59|nr:hypothetical protein [Legionella nagasakiensis]
MQSKKILRALLFLLPTLPAHAIDKDLPNFNSYTYFGLSGGYGNIKSSREPFIIKSGLINQIQDQNTFIGLLNVNPENGGASGRIYTGFSAKISNRFPISLGPEIGYSHYASSTVSASEHIAFDPYVDLNYNDQITNKAYGLDLLLNASFTYQRIILSLKPGVQYAIQKGTVYSRLTAAQEGEELIDLPLRNSKFKTNKVLPEIAFQAKWQVIPNKPVFLGLSYQYVHGQKTDNYEDNKFDQVNTRNMASIDIELHFS